MSTNDPTIEEYKHCGSMIRHLDEQNWSWGAFLFGGSLAAIGFVLSQRVTFSHLAAIALISTIVLVGWLAYVKRMADTRDIYADRMRAIEVAHSMKIQAQHVVQRGLVLRGNKYKPIFPIRAFRILMMMVILYLAALWAGAFFILLRLPIP
jgi:hypothetical protein